jgi:hypothetical protein
MLSGKQAWTMHENEVHFAIQRALRRLFPELEKTEDGWKKLDNMILEIMTEIKEAGIRYVNARGK